jgi:hypothetical protein
LEEKEQSLMEKVGKIHLNHHQNQKTLEEKSLMEKVEKVEKELMWESDLKRKAILEFVSLYAECFLQLKLVEQHWLRDY